MSGKHEIRPSSSGEVSVAEATPGRLGGVLGDAARPSNPRPPNAAEARGKMPRGQAGRLLQLVQAAASLLVHSRT